MRNQHKIPRAYRSNDDVIPALIIAILITAAAVAWGFFSIHLPAAQDLADYPLADYPTVAALPQVH